MTCDSRAGARTNVQSCKYMIPTYAHHLMKGPSASAFFTLHEIFHLFIEQHFMIIYELLIIRRQCFTFHYLNVQCVRLFQNLTFEN